MYNGKEATYGSWMPTSFFEGLLKLCLIHNVKNVKFPVENCLDKIFDYIIDELDFFEETDKGHTINDNDIDVTYELMYHNEFGLMFEGIGKLKIYPTRVYIEVEEK